MATQLEHTRNCPLVNTYSLAPSRMHSFAHSHPLTRTCQIENQEGLDNYDDILAETDGIMVVSDEVTW